MLLFIDNFSGAWYKYVYNKNELLRLDIHTEISKMAKKEDRFEVIYKEGSQLKSSGVRQILVDKKTGVNYLV